MKVSTAEAPLITRMLCDQKLAQGSKLPILSDEARREQMGSTRVCACSQIRRKKDGDFAFVPLVVLALLPKCPMCIALWLGVASVITPYPWLESFWLALTVVLVACALVSLSFAAWRSRNVCPFLLSIIGLSFLLVRRFVWDSAVLACLGFCLIAMAIILSRNSANVPFKQRT